jgi:hypothetical protein
MVLSFPRELLAPRRFANDYERYAERLAGFHVVVFAGCMLNHAVRRAAGAFQQTKPPHFGHRLFGQVSANYGSQLS